jgi:hypothetical protein
MARALIVVALALVLAAQVIRNAVVAGIAPIKPRVAARVWPQHPDVELSLGMIAIAQAAHDRKPVDDAVFKMIDNAAARAPLAPEPFLVRGIQAQLAGRMESARQAFLAAELRDPRSLPARYFLANQYFRSGNARDGLKEFAALARLAPNGASSVAPYVAAFATNRANWPDLRALFRSEPDLEDPVLTALAARPANADAVIALADSRHRNAGSRWLPPLLYGLVDAGQYDKARAIWALVSGVSLDPRQLVHDAQFSDRDSPPPFNWALTSSTVGLAERQSGGRLHVIYYGQEDGELVRQLLVLAPGNYRVSMRVAWGQARTRNLRWTLTCAKSRDPIASVDLDSAAQPWTVAVPSGCPAQNLALAGTSSDIPQQTEVTISGLTIVREVARG